MSLPIRCLSVRQPWAHASSSVGTLGDFSDSCEVIRDLLDEEAWETFRDEHLGIRMHGDEAVFLPRTSLPRGGIVGRAHLDGILHRGAEGSADEAALLANRGDVDTRWWRREDHGLVLVDVERLPLVPCKGMLRFFRAPSAVCAAVAAHDAMRGGPS